MASTPWRASIAAPSTLRVCRCALMAGATGETSPSGGEGRLQNKAMDWAAGDLLVQVLGAINPLAKSEDSTQMTCAAVRFVIRDGVATTDKGLAMRTAKVDVVGSGTVDLRSEQLDLGIKPRPRGGVGLSLSSPLAGLVRVNGTLAKPSMGIDAGGTLKTAASVGAGVGTGGLAALGGLLLDNGAWDRVGDLLVESDFYRYEHRLIYGAVGALINASKPADVITVFEHLQNQGKAEESGGLAYLNSLAQYVPSASNIRRYAEIVRERSILRKLVSASDEIATNAFNPQGRAVDRILDEAEFGVVHPDQRIGAAEEVGEQHE